MIISMTGFGKAEGIYDTKRYKIEITSVNNRFLEISLRFPRRFGPKELLMKEALKAKISRGKINAFVEIEGNSIANKGGLADVAKVKDFYALAKKINKLIGSDEKVTLRDIIALDEFITHTEESTADAKEAEFIIGLLQKAAEDLNRMKEREGKMLEKDMLKRVSKIQKESEAIGRLSKKRVKSETERIRAKLDALIAKRTEADDKRLETELIIFADKIDITEELTRLKSHTKYFADYARSKEPAGRRLNFLIQEMNREINTIASKSPDAEIAQKSATLKEELEKIREQLQNIE